MRETGTLRVGVLGGTFDPFHGGHLAIARGAAERLKLDHVLIVPARIPPHKGKVRITDGYHRHAMAVLATEAYPNLYVSRTELNREGPSYTIDTMSALAHEPGRRVCFLAGADSLREIHLWRECDRLFREHCLVFVPRSGVEVDLSDLKIGPELKMLIQTLEPGEFPELNPGSAFILPLNPPPVSSTGIRDELCRGIRPPRTDLGSRVYRYIRKYRLYEEQQKGTAEEDLRGH